VLQPSSETEQANRNSLPDLTRVVKKELSKCNKELSKLPPLPKDTPLTVIMLSTTAFCQAIQDAVFGEQYEHFVQSNRYLYSNYKKEIDVTIPDFRPFDGDVSGQTSLVPFSQTEPRGLDDIRQIIKR
jgi:hypothetical protein